MNGEDYVKKPEHERQLHRLPSEAVLGFSQDQPATSEEKTSNNGGNKQVAKHKTARDSGEDGGWGRRRC